MEVVAGNHTMTDEIFSTYLTEIERIINGRPIPSVSSDPRDLNALTKNALLRGSLDPFFPLGTFLKADEYRRSWKRVSMFGPVGCKNICHCCSKSKSSYFLRGTLQKEIQSYSEK